MPFFDTHAHLTDEQFTGEVDDVIARAETAGVSTILTVGTTVETSRQAIAIARRHPLVRAAVGIHPNEASHAADADWDEICRLAGEPEVVAIGETGLDRFRNDTPFEIQLDYFDRHANLARTHKLPIVIHCRDAEADVLACLERWSAHGPVSGIMHSFTGSAAGAARSIELGLHISFAGQLTFKQRKFDAIRELARGLPLDRLLVETDSPYLAPEPYRGKRNEPAHVSLTAARLAELRGADAGEIASATTANARRLLGG